MTIPSRNIFAYLGKSSFLAAIGIAIAGCSGGDNVDPQHISCDGIIDCTDSPNRPVCGDEDTVICKPVDLAASMRVNECVWRVSTADTCQCTEGEVRVCELTATTSGVKTCQTTGSNATVWGACTAL